MFAFFARFFARLGCTQMSNFAPRVLLFSGKREDPGDEVRYFMDLGKGPKHDCNFWIWSVKGND